VQPSDISINIDYFSLTELEIGKGKKFKNIDALMDDLNADD
jgi:hypothetical protein